MNMLEKKDEHRGARAMKLKKMSSRFGLTPRESEVLKYVLRGMKNAEVARDLQITEQTVKDHLSRIYRKIGVENRFELMYLLVKESDERLTELSKNISKLKRVEKDLRDVLLVDELTGLYNRRGFTTLVEHHMRIAKREKSRIYLLFSDVDDLKLINDSFGHHEGDAALRCVSDLLRDTFRDSDIIARVGGDEFVVSPLGTSQGEADVAASRLQTNLEELNSNGTCGYPLYISYGISYYDPESDFGIEELLLQADRAMYLKKTKKPRT